MITTTDTDEFAVLAAMWILASNDDNPLITYRSVQDRLNLPESFDVRELVRRHGELFRLRMPPSRLDQWKSDMRAGRRLPSWLKEATAADRAQLIDALTPEDGFRSQFRSGADAPRSDVAVIEWGLGHIERLRKAKSEARAATAKSWQMWLVLGATILGVIATIVAAVLRK
jgi:hypothetical protein